MGKLQLYITIAYKGYREMLDINADPKVKESVSNLSHVVGKIKYKTGKMNIFFMLRYIPDGVFLTVLRTIPALKPDHLAAWIFIPYDVKVSNTEIEEVTGTVLKAISNSKITSETYSELCKVFEKDYENIPLAGAMAPNNGKQTAYRFYGDLTAYILSDLIGTKRYQTSYLPFAEVVLADKGSVSDINGHSLTDEPLDQMVKLYPPVSPDPAFRPTIFGCEFDKPYLAPLMGTVEIRWMNGDTPAAVQSIMVNRPNMKPDIVALEELMPTTGTLPQVSQHAEATHNPDYQSPQPKQTPPAATQTHHRSSLTQTQSAVHHATSSESPYFQSQTRSYQTEEGASLIQKPESTFKSYISAFYGNIKDFFKSLSTDPFTRTKALWGLVGFLTGVLVTMLCTCVSNHGNGLNSKVLDLSSDSLEIASPVEIVEVADPGVGAPEESNPRIEENPAERSMMAAITYLEGFKTWTKPELEKYPELRGLYDDLNNFNKERIVSHWGPKLKKSKRFTKIVEHARQAIKRGKKPRVPEGQKTFNPPGRQNIKIMTYLNTIDP